MQQLAVIVAAVVALIVAVSRGGDGESGTNCPDLEGASLAQVEGMFGREPDHVENYGPGIPFSYEWYFRDDDQVLVSLSSRLVDSHAWHDGGVFMHPGDLPDCPLPEPDEDHPARFNIDSGDRARQGDEAGLVDQGEA